MKILFVVEHFYPYVGGAEELFLNLTVSLVQAGYEVEVVTTLHDKSLDKYEEYLGVKISRINCYNRFLFTVLSLPQIIRKAGKADCIHTTSYNSAIPSFIAGVFLRKKIVITFHEVWGKLWFRLPFTKRWLLTCYYLFEKFILNLSFFKYVAVSEYTRNSLIENGIPEKKIIKIYNGLNYEKLKPYRHKPPEKFTFCFFGRLGISKGIDLLLEAAQMFIARNPEAVLKLIIPTYPNRLYKKVMSSIKHYQIENNIILLHNLTKENLLEEVVTSSCVIIPSYSEGFCYVAVESVGLGVPVISSGKGSLPEVVGGQFITIDKLNAEALLNALEKAINNEWDNKIPKYFPLQESMEAYLNLYQSLKFSDDKI